MRTDFTESVGSGSEADMVDRIIHPISRSTALASNQVANKNEKGNHQPPEPFPSSKNTPVTRFFVYVEDFRPKQGIRPPRTPLSVARLTACQNKTQEPTAT
jgi:hypothetical protein